MSDTDPPEQSRDNKKRIDHASVMSDRALSETSRLRNAVKNKVSIPRSLNDDSLDKTKIFTLPGESDSFSDSVSNEIMASKATRDSNFQEKNTKNPNGSFSPSAVFVLCMIFFIAGCAFSFTAWRRLQPAKNE